MFKQRPNLIVEHLDDELMVYDESRHQASNLNATAARVFTLCDGTLDFEGLCARLAESVGSDHSEALAHEALEVLLEKGLVTGTLPAMASGRRDFLKRVLVGAALAVPVVYSVVAPTPAAAASGGIGLSSDRRLKRDLQYLLTRSDGVRLYRFCYLWSDVPYVGVLAQEMLAIHPQAVSTDPDGFYRVDYGRLGFDMQTYADWVEENSLAQR